MADPHGFCETLCAHAGYAAHHLDLLVVAGLDSFEDQVGRVDDPAPSRANGVGPMTPAEDALVGAGERAWFPCIDAMRCHRRSICSKILFLEGRTWSSDRSSPLSEIRLFE